MSKVQTITPEIARRNLDYNPDTGLFHRKNCQLQHLNGKEAGCVGGGGYVYIRVRGAICLGHRLAWMFVHGSFPSAGVVHLNGDKSDNRISNLADLADVAGRSAWPAWKSNSSGYRGVHLHKSSGKYAASRFAKGRSMHLGLFERAEDAAAAYASAARDILER